MKQNNRITSPEAKCVCSILRRRGPPQMTRTTALQREARLRIRVVPSRSSSPEDSRALTIDSTKMKKQQQTKRNGRQPPPAKERGYQDKATRRQTTQEGKLLADVTLQSASMKSVRGNLRTVTKNSEGVRLTLPKIIGPHARVSSIAKRRRNTPYAHHTCASYADHPSRRVSREHKRVFLRKAPLPELGGITD